MEVVPHLSMIAHFILQKLKTKEQLNVALKEGDVFNPSPVDTTLPTFLLLLLIA